MSTQDAINKKYSEEIAKAREIGHQYNPNVYGQFPWDAGEWPRDGRQHRSLNMSKSSLGTFCEAALRHRMGITHIHAFNPSYKRCSVLIRCHATLAQRDSFMSETNFWLAPPPMPHLN